ncbi:MAG TPA: hypothetical protein PK310_05315 [Paludibacteraceae bacterium]|nr:hypothetical protein [Paludibacteraceae bacterium]HQO48523.1 hypothetical protein [Paludibacteraceae bacterium]
MRSDGAIVVLSEQSEASAAALLFADTIGKNIKRTVVPIVIGGQQSKVSNVAEIGAFVDNFESAMLVFDLRDIRKIQTYLSACRNIRIPYCFVKPEQTVDFKKIAVPISMLIEDKEKGPFASMFGRFFSSEITVFEPNDYGSKAKKNSQAICTLFDSFHLSYQIRKGRKNSFGIEFEVAISAHEQGYGLVIVSASREYGLDDIIFGCKEKKIIKKAQVPIMLINPRADLYTLCD